MVPPLRLSHPQPNKTSFVMPFLIPSNPFTVLQDGKFAALKEREIFMILTNFESKNHHFGHFYYLEKIVKNSQNWRFWLQKSPKFEENSNITNHSLVPQIYHPVALCKG